LFVFLPFTHLGTPDEDGYDIPSLEKSGVIMT